MDKRRKEIAENFEAMKIDLDGTFPFHCTMFTDPDCGDRTETHTVREWLRDFGISEEDKFFLKWQKTILDLSGIFRDAEKKADTQRMLFVWNLTFVALYLNYETEKDFLPQFEENAKGILGAVRKMLCGGNEK